MHYIDTGIGFIFSFSTSFYFYGCHRIFCLLTEPTTAAVGKGPYNPKEVALLELGPVLVHEEELRVRQLPQEKVAEPVLAGRADQDVWVGTVRCKERILKFFFGNVVW